MMERLLGRDAAAGMRGLRSFRADVRLAEDPPSPNALDACRIALNLLPRMLGRVRYEGPASALEEFPASHRSSLGLGGGGEAEATVVFGGGKISGARNALYVGSSGWSSYLSRSCPCPWVPAVPNALGAMHAGALAAGEVFKTLVPGAEPAAHLEYDLATHGSAGQPVTDPPVPDAVDLGDLAIVGCGAIGQALCCALAGAARLEGRITLIDHDRLEESNEQRYLTAFKETRDAPKTRCAGEVLSARSPQLHVDEVTEPYEAYAASRDVRFPEMAVCVDNALTRILVQGALPRVLWNGWTDVERGSLRYGVGRHSLAGDLACLACCYLPRGSPDGADLDAAKTGLGRDRIMEIRGSGEPCDMALLREVARKGRVRLRSIRRFEGRPFDDLLHGDCGVYRQGPGETAAATPAPHQPVLAGILLASQLVLERIAPGSALRSVSDFEALGEPGRMCLFNSARRPECFCGDPVYRRAYEQKWGASVPA